MGKVDWRMARGEVGDCPAWQQLRPATPDVPSLQELSALNLPSYTAHRHLYPVCLYRSSSHIVRGRSSPLPPVACKGVLLRERGWVGSCHRVGLGVC